MLLRKLKKRTHPRPRCALGKYRANNREGGVRVSAMITPICCYLKQNQKKVSQMNTRHGKNYKKLISELD